MTTRVWDLIAVLGDGSEKQLNIAPFVGNAMQASDEAERLALELGGVESFVLESRGAEEEKRMATWRDKQAEMDNAREWVEAGETDCMREMGEWLAVWHDDLVTALAIMDKGKSIPGSSIALWSEDHDRLRHNILSVKDSIEEQLDKLEDAS